MDEIKRVSSYREQAPTWWDLPKSAVLELFYDRYSFGFDDNSNWVLLDINNKVVAINWKGMEHTSIFRSDIPSGDSYLFNKKLVKLKLSYKDFEEKKKTFDFIIKKDII